MMEKVILYKEANGVIAIINPSPNCGLPIEEIARKDTPEGVAYKIINRSELPSDLSAKWDFDFNNPDGVGVGHKVWFAERGIEI